MTEGLLYRKILSTTYEDASDWADIVTVKETQELAKAIVEVLDEARNDLGLDRFIYKKADLEKMLEDGAYTQFEKSHIRLCLKLLEWFGEGEVKQE